MKILFDVTVTSLLQAAELEEALQKGNFKYSYKTLNGSNAKVTKTGIRRPKISKEKRKQIRAFIRRNKKMPNLEIAKKFGVSSSTVGRERTAVEVS